MRAIIRTVRWASVICLGVPLLLTACGGADTGKAETAATSGEGQSGSQQSGSQQSGSQQSGSQQSGNQQSTAQVPDDAFSLLSGRLFVTVSEDAGAKDDFFIRERPRSIMAAPMASEKETILFSEKVFSDGVLEGGDARFAMITEEMFRLCGDDFGARVEQVAAGWTKADGEQFEATEISADPALTVYTVTGETPYIQDGVAHLANAFVCHPDGTAQTVRFLVSGPRPEDLVEDGNARAQALLQGLLAGDRELARDARTLELPSYAKDSPLKIDVPADYGVYTNEGPDFVVHYITAMTPINDPYNTLGIYLGDHPSPHREAESEEPGELMGKPVKWQQSTSSADGGGQTWHRETLVKPDVSGVPTYAHIFITADDEAGMAEMMKVVETLRF